MWLWRLAPSRSSLSFIPLFSSSFSPSSHPAREGCRQPLYCLHGVELHHHPGPTGLPQPPLVLLRLRLLVPQRLRTGPLRPLRAWRARGTIRWPGQGPKISLGPTEHCEPCVWHAEFIGGDQSRQTGAHNMSSLHRTVCSRTWEREYWRMHCRCQSSY